MMRDPVEALIEELIDDPMTPLPLKKKAREVLVEVRQHGFLCECHEGPYFYSSEEEE